ncbi:MAG: phosphomannomutase/phosphoglucomutase, partial [Clostridia bacterium]|nr:phosphomannomutase/phosphoglucomutase [Clostridia bacterium]
MSIYKDCDVRGIYEKEITAADTYKIGRALATLAPGKILAGGDVRLSTPELKAALIKGLLESGAEVVDLGTIPTPALYYALKHSDAVAGATVTASHNPPKYNGVKFMIGSDPVTRPIVDKLQAVAEGGEYAAKTGSIEKWNVCQDYLAFLGER